MIKMAVSFVAVAFCSYGIGYFVGWRSCFNYLKSELEKMKENKQ